MAVEGRAVLLAEDQDAIRRRELVRGSCEELPVEDAVVLVADLFADHVQVFGAAHEHHVFRRVVEVASVIHVRVIGTAVPALRVHVDHAAHVDLHSLA